MKKYLRLIFEGWKKTARIIGIINTYIILTLVYYLLITPIGLILQLADILKTQKPKSYWTTIPKRKITLEELAKQH